jgi:arylsulfatase A-like enzyme
LVVISGDDIGMWNVGAYDHGMMGRTPHIDSIAKDGIQFTDRYGHPVARLAGPRSSWGKCRFVPA